MDRLFGDHGYIYEDTDRTKGMEFVQKYLRMKQVIVFKMSHDVLQFNFYDHSKLILSSHGLHITHIDKSYNLTRFSLAEIMANALQPPPSDPEQARFHGRLLTKLQYAKEVLTSIKNASQQNGTSEAGDSDAPAPAPPVPASAPAPAPAPAPIPAPAYAPGAARSVMSRLSKTSLR